MKKLSSLIAAAAVAALACSSAAAKGPEVDPATLYELSLEGSTTQLKAGEKGKLVFTIKTKNTGHISDQPPFKLSFEGKGLQLEKTAVKLAESSGPKPKHVADEQANHYEDVRFEVPFTAQTKGAAVIDAKLKFAICADQPKKVCIMLPQQTRQHAVTVL